MTKAVMGYERENDLVVAKFTKSFLMKIEGVVKESITIHDTKIEIIDITEQKISDEKYEKALDDYGLYCCYNDAKEVVETAISGEDYPEDSPYIWSSALIKRNDEYSIVTFDFFDGVGLTYQKNY
ncbi:MAG: hypothetical protein ABF991_00090 [Liquorilactobacillus hordei]|uniref:hypothetical protein n=1 Tax=Liquorilactobacillus hordei TaxID=468911 RepID=UPI0039ED6052